MTQEKLERAKALAETITEWENILVAEQSKSEHGWPIHWPEDMVKRHRAEKIDFCQCRLEELRREFDAL